MFVFNPLHDTRWLALARVGAFLPPRGLGLDNTHCEAGFLKKIRGIWYTFQNGSFFLSLYQKPKEIFFSSALHCENPVELLMIKLIKV